MLPTLLMTKTSDSQVTSRLFKSLSRAARSIYLVVAGSALLGCVIIAGTVSVIVNLRAQTLANTERELRNVALVLAEQIDRSFEAIALVQSGLIERMDRLGNLSADKLWGPMASREAYLMLKDAISGLPHIESLTITDAQGIIVNSSRFWPIPPLSVEDREYYKVLKASQHPTSVLSELILNRTTGTASIYLARKFFGPNGQMIGIVIGGMEQKYFERYFGTINLGSGSAISLLRFNGELIASHPAQRQLAPSEASRLRTLSDRADHEIAGVTDADGRENLVAVRAVTHYPMIVSVSVGIGDVLDGWRSQAIYLGIAAAVAVLMIAGVTFLSIRSFRHYATVSRERRERTDTAAHHKATEFVLREAERVRQLLTKQKAQLDAALENMSQGLIMLDANARMLICNQRYIDIYGLSPEIVKPGCTFRDLIKHQAEIGLIDGDVDEIVERIQAAIAQGSPSSDLRTLADGRMISVSLHPMAEGGCVATHQDVTEQFRAQRDTERAQKFLMTVVESVPSIIVVKDARTLKYLLFNRAAEKFYGFVRAEVMGRKSQDLFPKETAAMIVAYDKKLLESSGQLNLSAHSVWTLNGPRVVTARQVVIRDERARPMFLLSIIEEVGAHKAVA
jgi:PAS domain S-box-containing protein